MVRPDETGERPGPQRPDDLRPALRDVGYQLTHNLKDTPQDLRDAAAFAPLAIIKTINAWVSRGSAHPKRSGVALALLGLAVALGLAARSRRRRR